MSSTSHETRMKTVIKSICFILSILLFKASNGQNSFSSNPDSVVFHTEDIHSFWKVFDKTSPDFSPAILQEEYINTGSKGLKGFIKMRIENGRNLSATIKENLQYYQSIRESSLSIDNKKERLYGCFRKLQKIYSKAVLPDVYFVIGAKNSGGTTFGGGLIIGAEMFGKATESFTPVLDIDYVDEVVVHELIHFQQNYAVNKSLLAQCIREGSADFICELIAGDHSNKKIYEYAEAHRKELWEEFLADKDNADWSKWLYGSKDKSRPKDLGYWIGYKIAKSYYDRMEDKVQAVIDILNITDFNEFLRISGYNGE